MASAKKGKKNKGKTLALQDFLQETPGAVPSMPIRKSTLNWADEVEDNHDMYDSRSSKPNVVLPTAPKASRDLDDINDKVPQNPPFMAYLSNLPYDVDESEISFIFKNLKISNMRIPKDDRPGEMPKLKGYGYVEFEDRDSLLNALVIPDIVIKNRRIRIEVATDYDNDKRRGGRMDMNRDRGGRSDVSMGDWRSGPRQESSNDGPGRGFSRDRDRDTDNTTSMWRDGPRNNRDSDRGFSRSNFREDRDQDYNSSRSQRGGDRERDGGFMSRRSDRDDRSFSRNGGGGGGGGGSFTRGPPKDEGESSRSNEPMRERRKLVLTPRTKPVENEEKPAAAAPAVVAAPPTSTSSSSASSASIFGNAKPVDTSARERQIEERLAKDNTSDTTSSRRELSKERRGDGERKGDSNRERHGQQEIERRPMEKERSPPATNQPKSDVNGVVVDKSSSHQTKRNGGDQQQQPPPQPQQQQQQQKDGIKEGGDNKKIEKKEKLDKEMPKLKKADPPNFIANNKFAFLDTEDNSD